MLRGAMLCDDGRHGMCRWGAFGRTRTDAHGAQPGGFRGVGLLWHVPVGVIGGVRADAHGGSPADFVVYACCGMCRWEH